MKRDPRIQLGRRSFVLTGLVGVAAAAAGSSLPVIGRPAWDEGDHLIVKGSQVFGYWTGSSTLPELQGLQVGNGLLRLKTTPASNAGSEEQLRFAEASRLVAADTLHHGSQELRNRMAAVGIHGIYSADGNWSDEFSSISLSSRFQIAIGRETETVDFLAWRMDNRGVLNEGDPIQFVAPVNHDLGLSFIVESCYRKSAAKFPSHLHSPSPETLLQVGGADERIRTCVRLSAGTQSGQPKLRRGVYFVNCGRLSGSSPFCWSDYRIRAVGYPNKEAHFRIEHRNPLSSSSGLRLLVLSIDVESPSTG